MASSGRKRYLIAIGVSEYDDREFPSLAKVKGDCETVVRLFTERFGYQQALPALTDNPTARRVRGMVSRWFAARTRRSEDIVIFYFGGHGFTTKLNQHYLCTREFRARNPSDTGVRSADLVSLFWDGEGERPQHVWVIIDTCLAGHGTGEMQEYVGGITKEVFTGPRAGFWTLAAARAIDDADDGKFVEALTHVLGERLAHRSFGAASQEQFGVDGLLTGINTRLKEFGQLATFGATAATEDFPFLPNPRFRPGSEGRDLESQDQVASSAELTLHWIPKAQGTEPGESGWFFSGRTRALTDLIAWLEAPESDHRARIVTGDPGSGKSAVLSRIVTLAHKASRKTIEQNKLLEGVPPGSIPPVGVVDLAIHARNKSLQQVRALLGVALGTGRHDYARALEVLAKRTKPFRIVLDALDESPDASRILSDVLKPLASLPSVRLIVGTRRPLVKAFGYNGVALDLDTTEYLTTSDIEAYVMMRLVNGVFGGKASPYKDAAVARVVAQVVARKAHPSFLIARLVCSRLGREREPIDISAAGWEKRLTRQLPATLSDAYDDDLQRFGKHRQRVIDVLRPLAYARGQGLPWEQIWEAVASEISGRRYSRSDIEEVLHDAGFYIVEDREAGVSVYRLFHESFADYLRGGVDSDDIERRFVRSLIGTVHAIAGVPDWLTETRHYLRTHLPGHAATAGHLPELVANPSFLAVANVDALLPLLRRSRPPVPPSLRRLYTSAVHNVRRSGPPDGLSYLELAAKQNGVTTMPFPQSANRSWSVPWARWQSLATSRVIETGHRPATAITTFTMDGRAVVATGGREGTVRIWDLETGKAIGEPLQVKGRVRQILAGGADDPPVVAVFAGDSMRFDCSLWDLRSGGVSSAAHQLRGVSIRAGTLAQRPALLIRNHRGEPTWWVLEGGHLLQKTSRDLEIPERIASRDTLRDLAYFTDVAGSPIAFLLGRMGVLQTLDLRTGKRLGKGIKVRQSLPYGQGMQVESNQDGIRVWTAFGREIGAIPLTAAAPPHVALRGSNGRVDRLALSNHQDSRMLVSGDGSNIRIWDLDETEVDRNPRAWTGQSPRALCAFERDGRTLLAIPTADRIVICDAADGTEVESGDAKTGSAFHFVCHLSGRPFIVLVDDEKAMRVFDCTSGTPLGKPMRPKEQIVTAAVVECDGKPVVIAICRGENKTITAWDLMRGRRIGSPNAIPANVPEDAIVCQAGQRPLLITHGDQTLTARDAMTLKVTRKRKVVGELTAWQVSSIDSRAALVATLTSHDGPYVGGWWLDDLSPAFAPLRSVSSDIAPVVGDLHSRRVIACRRGSAVQLWTLDGRQALDVTMDARVNSLALVAPQRIVVGTNKGVVAIDWHI